MTLSTTVDIVATMASRKKTKPPKNRKYPGDLRRALIDAALETIEEDNGAGVLTLRGVARRVGVSHAAPHRHFADKKALAEFKTAFGKGDK